MRNYIASNTLCASDKKQEQDRVFKMKLNSCAVIFLAFLLPTKVWAELSQGSESDMCYQQNNDDYHRAHKCLTQKKNQIFTQYKMIVGDVNTRILKNYDGPVFKSEDPDLTVGTVYSKYFLESQKDWEKYREKICLGVASEIGEDTYDYQPAIDQCEINLTKRHIDEIKMMGVLSVQ